MKRAAAAGLAAGLVLLAGCSALGGTPSQTPTETDTPADNEEIAELTNLSAKSVETDSVDYCRFDFTITKEQGVLIQLKNGVASEFYGNGEYHYQQETEISDFLILNGGSGKTVEINAYETPDDGTGKSLQLWKGEVTEDCSVSPQSGSDSS